MAQYVYRRPPYSYYDIEGIESWLEDLITDGLWLDKNGYVFGFMQFRPGTPLCFHCISSLSPFTFCTTICI